MSAPLVKFQTRRYGSKIERVECTRETESSVFFGTQRQAKWSDWVQFHESWSDAHQHLMTSAEHEVAAARRGLELANAKLGNIKGMKPPTA